MGCDRMTSAGRNPLADLDQGVTPALDRISDYPYFFAANIPDELASICAAGELSYAAFVLEIDFCARALIAAGISPGDRVAMLSAPNTRFLVVFLATVRIGAIWLGLNPRHQLAEYDYVLGDARPALLFAYRSIHDRDFSAELEALDQRHAIPLVMLDDAPAARGSRWSDFLTHAAECPSSVHEARARHVDGGDPALLVYTSGSTGRPKGALLSHRGLIKGARRRGACWWHGRFRTLMNLPINHIGGVGDIVCTTLVTGGLLAFMERFDAAGSLAFIERHALTFWYQIPTQMQLSLAAVDPGTYDLSSLKAVIWSGARAPRDLIDQLALICPQGLGTDYSMTEFVGAVTMTPLGASRDVLENSVGWPDPEREVRLADSGEIFVRDDAVMLGYLNRPAATAEAIDSDGWLRTGDVGQLREDGSLALIGRLREMFKSGGYNVYPREIEEVLESHPSVSMAAVIGIPDPLYGEVGQAFVALKPAMTASEAELRALCRSRLANYKLPKLIVIETSLPLLPVGKIDKSSLRARVTASGT